MPIDEQRDILTKMLLVACDQSYQPGPGSNTPPVSGIEVRVGDSLRPYLDNGTSVDRDSKYQMPVQWYDLRLSDGTQFTSWRVEQRFDDRYSGFGATVYSRDAGDGKRDYIVALQGTRGQNIQDWSGNLIYGWDKWTADTEGANGPDLTAFLVSIGDIHQIHFTGQSLGGALAQYAAYDFVDSVLTSQPDIRSRTTLTTFNGLGAVEALTQRANDPSRNGFNPDLLVGVDTAHFVTDNDLVNRFGTGNLNGSGHEYLLRTVATNDDGSPVTRPNGTFVKVSPIPDAHRIETGFYYTFNQAARDHANRMPLDFTQAIAQPIQHLQIAGIANAGTAIAWLSNKDGVNLTKAESWARLVAAILAGMAYGPKEQAAALLRAMSLQVGESWESEQREYLFRGLLGEWAPSFLTTFAKSQSGTSLQEGALIVAAFLESANTLATRQNGGADAVNIGPQVSNLIEQMLATVPPGIGNFDLKTAEREAQIMLSGAPGANELYVRFALKMSWAMFQLIPSIRDSAGVATAQLLLEITKVFINDPKGLLIALAQFSSDAIRDVSGGAIDPEATAQLIAKNLTMLSDEALSAAQEAAHAVNAGVEDVERFYDEIVEYTSQGIERVVNSVANGYSELVLKRDDAFEWGVDTSRSTLIALAEGFKNVSRGVTALVTRNAVVAAESASQAIIVTLGTGISPYGAPGQSGAATVDPDLSESAVLLERSGASFTLYLPFNAGPGGQKVLLRASGPNEVTLRLMARTEVPNDNGTFTVTIPEGSRQLALAFSQHGDIDDDSTLEIRAQLINASGNPTHAEHVEFTLTLDGESEVAIADAPGQTSLTILGDQRTREFIDVVDATGGPVGQGYVPYVPTGDFERHFWTSLGYTPLENWINWEITDAAYAIESVVLDQETGITTISFRATSYTVLHNTLDDLGNLITEPTPDPDKGERLYGSTGADLIDAHGGRDIVFAKAGNDTVYAGSGNDFVEAGPGDDWVDGGSGDDYLYGNEGNDRLIGGAGIDFLSGDISEAYILNRGFVSDSSTQLTGDDVLEGGLSPMDMLIGGG
ncbi:MAG: hypothetical protein ABI580_04280, partial [Burkholderiaceae bacterium]